MGRRRVARQSEPLSSRRSTASATTRGRAPRRSTPEGEVVSWADRIAYSCHDFEDAVSAGIVNADELPAIVRERCGVRRSQQLGSFINAMIRTIRSTGVIGMDARHAEALAAFRTFNYETIYLRGASRQQASSVVAMLRALVEYFAIHPALIPDVADGDEALDSPALALATQRRLRRRYDRPFRVSLRRHACSTGPSINCRAASTVSYFRTRRHDLLLPRPVGGHDQRYERPVSI